MFDISGFHPVVGVGEDDEFALCGIDARIPGRGQAAVGLVDHPDEAGIFCGVAVTQGRARISGAVVDQDDFKVPAGLGQHGIHAPHQQGLHIVNGDRQSEHGLTSVVLMFYSLAMELAYKPHSQIQWIQPPGLEINDLKFLCGGVGMHAIQENSPGIGQLLRR